MLVDFGARWCPSCVRLEDEIFGTTRFKNMTKDFVKVKIDVDRFENTVVSEKYSVKGIPTLLVVNSDAQEISRMVDFQTLDVWNSFFSSIKADPLSLSKLKERAKSHGMRVRSKARWI